MSTRRYISILLISLASVVLGLEGERCESEIASISKNYPTANFETCAVLNSHTFILAIQPEDYPINPSPWYGFLVERKNNEIEEIIVTLRYEAAPHRYEPKYSFDKTIWTRLESQYVQLVDDFTTTLTIPQGSRFVYVSAQPIIAEQDYHDWTENLSETFPFLTKKTIGYSVARRKIEAFVVGSRAPRVIILLGRQHPPEITGAVAFMAFAETLLNLKLSALGEGSGAVRDFFDQYMLVFVPLLNPDGVESGHWRHNRHGKDLNRDWFAQSQPEIQAVLGFVAELERNGKQVVLHLDFHSTNRDVLYTQMPDDKTEPQDFAFTWLEMVKNRGIARLPEHAPRPLSDQGTAKGYFFKTYGIPSITYEVGDESNRDDVEQTATEFALALATIYGELVTNQSSATWQPCETLFCLMLNANGASLLVLDENGIIDGKLAGRIAQEQLAYKRTAEQEGWPTGQNYLTLEAFLIDKLGEEASIVHVGRSRQDLHGVARRMLVRQESLDVFASLIKAREALLTAAAKNADVVIPAYTHGVPSQPTSYGHMLLAFEEALNRDTDRLQDAYRRLNHSQLGVAAGSGSGFELDRTQLAEMLGFGGIVVNTFDANFLSTSDYKLEIAATLAQGVATVTNYIQNVHSQQRNPRPWLYLGEEMTSGSSIMPQKRNPRELDRLRTLGAEVLAGTLEQQLLSHNLDTGMHDYRTANPLIDTLIVAESMYRRFATLVAHVHVDAELALAELENGFSTSTEIADTLYREAKVPFRVGHEYAKQLVAHARDTRQRLRDLSNRDLSNIYEAVTGQKLPVSIDAVRGAMDPKYFVSVRNSLGGPAPERVHEAIELHQRELAYDERWLTIRRTQLHDAETRLNERLSALAKR